MKKKKVKENNKIKNLFTFRKRIFSKYLKKMTFKYIWIIVTIHHNLKRMAVLFCFFFHFFDLLIIKFYDIAF